MMMMMMMMMTLMTRKQQHDMQSVGQYSASEMEKLVQQLVFTKAIIHVITVIAVMAIVTIMTPFSPMHVEPEVACEQAVPEQLTTRRS